MPDFRRADHLPNNRPGGKSRHPSWLPRQRRGTTPQMVGRYPDYDVFDAVDTWDAATRAVVMSRLQQPAALRFFTNAEEPTYRAFCDRAIAQDGEPRVPVAEMVDAKLAAGEHDGYQYAGMPDDGETWRIVLRGLDESACGIYGSAFATVPAADQRGVVARFAEGTVSSGAWAELSVKHAWQVVMRMILSAFYAHPWAWNEIGYGGPAYPRGFMRLGAGGFSREPFEKRGATDDDPVPLAGRLEEG